MAEGRLWKILTSPSWKIDGLELADTLVDYALWWMVIYLSDEWEYNFTTAAMIVNIIMTIMTVMPIALQFAMDAYVGNYLMSLFNVCSYVVGLLLLSCSTIGCQEDDERSVCKVQQILFYLGLTLLVFGKPGLQLTSLDELNKKEEAEEEEGGRGGGVEKEGEDTRLISKLGRYLKLIMLCIVHVVGALVIPLSDKWLYRFGIPTVCMYVATVIFITGSSSYQKIRHKGSPLTTLFRVIKATLSRRSSSNHSNYPDRMADSSRQLNGGGDHANTTQCSSSCFRCFDKAKKNLPAEQDQQDIDNMSWNEDVEETKRAIAKIPLCLTFFLLGVISSVGDTYFVEQVSTIKPIHIGKFKVRLVVLQLLYNAAKASCSVLYKKAAKRLSAGTSSKKYAGCAGITVSMIFAILCCFVAANVESHRLCIAKSHGIYGTNDEVPMNILWLLPQFFLLGGLVKILEDSIDLFFSKYHVVTSSDRYMVFFAKGVVGIGEMGSTFLVYLTGKISAMGDGTSWFESNLNDSRLDKYYWVLAGLSVANLLFYIILYYCAGLRSHARSPTSNN